MAEWYDNASITIGGMPVNASITIGGVPVEGPPGPLPDFRPIDVTMSMTLADDSDPLDALALQAVCTPSLGASDALDVLVDALIERGRLDSPLQVFFTPEAWDRRRREVAFEWAEDRTLGPFGRIVRDVEEASIRTLLRPPPNIQTASGAALDLVAEHLFGLYRIEQPRHEYETDEALRARCFALLREEE